MATNNNINYTPAPIPGTVPTPVLGNNIDRAPAPVAPGAGTGYVPTVTQPVVVVTEQPVINPPIPAARNPVVVPVVEQPVAAQVVAESTPGPNITASNQQRYITILSNGTIVTDNASTLNFAGNGFTIASAGVNGATITINPEAGGYGNANVTTLLATFGSNVISTTGNVTAGYFLGNGSQLTGLSATYGNANVAANLAALGSNPVSTTGNVTGGNLLFGTGIVSGTGNITGGNLSVTSITGTLTTATQSAITGLGTLTNISTSGNANVTGDVNSARVSATGNVTAGNVLTGGLISATGNVSGSFFLGNGSQLTGLSAAASAALIENGTSNIKFSGSGANGTVNIGGTSNVAVFATTGAFITGVSSASGNVTGGNVLTGGLISATGNITANNISLTGNGFVSFTSGSTLTFGDTPVTNRYYVDATRTSETYVRNGSQARPFNTIAAAQSAIATAIAGGLNPEVEPIYIILLSNITENVTLATNHVYLVGQNGQIHQPIILTGNVTVQPTSGTLNSNHFSMSGIEVVGGTDGKAIYVTGTFPTRLSLQDMWITANGNSGAGLYQDNSGTGTYTHGGPIKVSHNGTGDVYCFDIRAGTASFESVETSGATQVGAAGPGATLTFNNSQLDANGDVVVETYGNGVVVVTNSVIKNSAANSYGIKLNAVANVAGTVSVGQSAFNVPAGTGQAVWLDSNTTPGLSGVFAWGGVSFYPNTNSTIAPLIIPAPLATLVGTIASPILYGDITSYSVAQDWDLIDNNASALSFDTTGKAGVLELVTTNSAEGVKMSGFASATGNVTGGNVLTGGLISATGNITGGNVLGGANVNATLFTGTTVSVTGNITGGNLIVSGGIVGSGASPAPSLSGFSTISTTGAAGNISASGNLLTAGYVSATGNITGGNLNAIGLSLSGNVVSALVSAANITTTANISGGYILGNGSQLTGIATGTPTQIVSGTSNVSVVSSSGNVTVGVGGTSNVVVIASTGSFTTGVALATGNVSGANINTTGVVSASANVSGSNLVTSGTVYTNTNGGGLISTTLTTSTYNIYTQNPSAAASKTINVGTGATISNSTTAINLGSQFGISNTTVYGNLIVANTLTSLSTGTASFLGNINTSANVSATGNVTGGNIVTTAAVSAASVSASANIAGGNITTPGLISATGNITGGNVLGGANVNATTHTGTTVSVSANITGGNLITGALTSTASLSVTGNTATITTANYSVGYLNIPQISFAANATAALVDSGKHYYSTSASNLALTLADNSAVSWPVGTALSIVNRGTANVTVAPAAGVSLYLAGNSTSANRVVTTYGMATVMNVASNIWMISGTVV